MSSAGGEKSMHEVQDAQPREFLLSRYEVFCKIITALASDDNYVI